MADVYRFPLEMQPAKPYDAARMGQLAVDPPPQHAPSVLPERVTPLYQAPSEDQWELLAAHDGLYALIQKYGASRVMTWVRSLATIAGQEVS